MLGIHFLEFVHFGNLPLPLILVWAYSRITWYIKCVRVTFCKKMGANLILPYIGQWRVKAQII